MNANAFLRAGVLMLLAGVVLGMHMGISQDFTASPAHAHLNLAGAVVTLLAGLVYAVRPGTPRGAMTLHFVLQVAGGVLLPTGIYGTVTQQAWAGPVVGTGSLLVLLATIVFAWNVFRAEPART